MSVINDRRASQKPQGAHTNYMGATSYFVANPIAQLRMAAASSFFAEPQYYVERAAPGAKKRVDKTSSAQPLSAQATAYLNETLQSLDPQEWRGLSPAALMERAIDAALDYGVEETLVEAVRLRQEDHIRTTPQVILVRAANHKAQKGTGLVHRYAPMIIQRADEMATGLAYQMAHYGKPIPNSLKKAWAHALAQLDDYRAAKYRMEGRQVKLTDVVGLVHPKSPTIDRLMKGELKNTDQTWEAIISAEGSNEASWRKAIDVMGHMATLRNVRNLIEKGVPPEVFVERLKEGAPRGKQLPFRYFSAYKVLTAQDAKIAAPPQVLDALEECLELAVGNLPRFQGRVMSLCDNSGSAWGTTTSSMGTMHVAEIANLTGVLTGKASEEGYVGVFGDLLEVVPIRKRESTFGTLDRLKQIAMRVGQQTENGIWLFWEKAIREKQRWDHVFIYSDMQAGCGQLYGPSASMAQDVRWPHTSTPHGVSYIDVPKLIQRYRRQVNANVMVYCVQVGCYGDSVVPEHYQRTYLLSGWSESVLRFAKAMEQQYGAKENPIAGRQ